ncbi:Protein GRAVITROPIC IN THE LIGHT 1 [Glycine soja]
MVEIISDANLKDERNTSKSKTILNWSESFNEDDDEDLQETEANEALLAKKQFDPSPKTAILEAESKELQGVIKTYEMKGKKLESQVSLKDSKIIFHWEKLEEANRKNKAIKNRLNQSGQLSILDNLHITGLSPSHKRVWLLHCLAFSYEPQASIFQVGKGCRFSDVYMESSNDEIFLYLEVESDPQVAVIVVPGFRIGKTILQCRVYLSQHQTKAKKNQFNKAKVVAASTY